MLSLIPFLFAFTMLGFQNLSGNLAFAFAGSFEETEGIYDLYAQGNLGESPELTKHLLKSATQEKERLEIELHKEFLWMIFAIRGQSLPEEYEDRRLVLPVSSLHAKQVEYEFLFTNVASSVIASRNLNARTRLEILFSQLRRPRGGSSPSPSWVVAFVKDLEALVVKLSGNRYDAPLMVEFANFVRSESTKIEDPRMLLMAGKIYTYAGCYADGLSCFLDGEALGSPFKEIDEADSYLYYISALMCAFKVRSNGYARNLMSCYARYQSYIDSSYVHSAVPEQLAFLKAYGLLAEDKCEEAQVHFLSVLANRRELSAENRSEMAWAISDYCMRITDSHVTPQDAQQTIEFLKECAAIDPDACGNLVAAASDTLRCRKD